VPDPSSSHDPNDLSEAQAAVYKIKDHFEKMHQSSAGVSKSMGEWTLHGNHFANGIAKQFAQSALSVVNLRKQADAINEVMHTRSRTYRDELLKINEQIKSIRATGSGPEQEREIAALRTQGHLLTRKMMLAKEFEKLQGKQAAMMLATAEIFRRALNYSQELSAQMASMPSALGKRFEYISSALAIDSKLGAGLSRTAAAAGALSKEGFKTRDAFESTLEVVLLMEGGMGLSVQQGAELANLFERRLKVGVKSIADLMANVVENTSLTADEFHRIAIEVGKSAALLNQMSSAKQVTAQVSAIEDALKKAGLAPNQFNEFFSKLRSGTVESMVSAGMLGLNPEDLMAPDAAERAAKAMAAMSDQINTMGDYQALVALQQISPLVGTNVETLKGFGNAMRTARFQIDQTTDAKKRFNEQMSAVRGAWTKLHNIFSAAAMRVLTPAVEILVRVFDAVATAATALQSKGPIIETMFAMTLPFVIGKGIKSIGTILSGAKKVFALESAAVAGAGAAARSGIMSTIAKRAAFAMGMTIAPDATITKVLAVIGWVVTIGTVFTATYALLKKWFDHSTKEDVKATEMDTVMATKIALREAVSDMLTTSRDPQEIRQEIGVGAEYLRLLHPNLTNEDINQFLAEQVQLVDNMVYAMDQLAPIPNTDENKEQQEMLVGLTKELVDTLKQNVEASKQSRDAAKQGVAISKEEAEMNRWDALLRAQPLFYLPLIKP
jgi:hypothetical protein